MIVVVPWLESAAFRNDVDLVHWLPHLENIFLFSNVTIYESQEIGRVGTAFPTSI